MVTFLPGRVALESFCEWEEREGGWVSCSCVEGNPVRCYNSAYRLGAGAFVVASVCAGLPLKSMRFVLDKRLLFGRGWGGRDEKWTVRAGFGGKRCTNRF